MVRPINERRTDTLTFSQAVAGPRLNVLRRFCIDLIIL